MTHPAQYEPVRYRVCNVDEAGQAQPLPDDPRFHEAMDQVARAAVRLAKADRERQLREFLAAWLAGQQHTIAAALAALPAGMAAQTQAANVHAALLAAAGIPDAQVTTEWGVQYPQGGSPLRQLDEDGARAYLDHARVSAPGAQLVTRTVVASAWRPAEGAR